MGEETVESILKFMNDGTNRIKHSPSKNIILVLGDSGTGKSTLTQLLASNDDYLIAEKAGGSGYTIVDTSKAICASTFVSCTVIPELVIDQAHNQTYYDCPGFRDTRSITHDISTSYFIRKVIEEAESIKIIFTLSYNSVRKGGSRHDFSKLVENVFNMFKDIRKYEESVCLVVSKVENVYEVEDGQLKIVPDDIMLQDIIEFLKESKNPQVNSLLRERTNELINILINDKDPQSPRIGIFRRPNKAGPLSKMKEFQNGKNALQKMIYDKLNYTHLDVNDFGYTIEHNSKLRLRDIEEEINQSLLDDASIIGQQLIEYFKEKEKRSNDIDELVQELIERLEKSMNLKRALSEGTVNARLFVQELIIFLDELNYIIPEEKRSRLSTFCDYLEFIETMIKTTQHQSDQWHSSLREVWRYLDESLNWYSFLIDLRLTLSEYSIQSDVETYEPLIDQFRSDISELNREDVIGFLEELLPKINDKTGRRYEIPNINDIGNTKINFLLDLMDVGFTPMNTECHEKKLEVKGFNIKMADVVKLMDRCDKPEVEVFALNKIFIDSDFIKKEAQLSMIAPELEVINNQKIVLDGEDGEEHDSRKAVTTDTSPGSDGSDGLPGLPGTSAGGLVTAVQNCKNCNSLTVSATGGRGGPGQDGGDGLQGSDGERANMVSSSANKDEWIENWRNAGFSPSCYTESRQRRGIFIPILAFLAGAAIATGATVKGSSGYQVTQNVSKRVRCYVYGLFGKSGGKGGDGGAGGEGGNEGRVSFVNAKSTPTNEGPKITVEKGHRGASGAGGSGGLGGLQGDTLTQELIENSLYTNSIGSIYFSGSNNRAENGMPGAANMNDNGLIHPKSVNHTLDVSNEINSYKNYLQLNNENTVMKSTWENFLEFLNIHGKTRRSLPSEQPPSTIIPIKESRFVSSKTNRMDPVDVTRENTVHGKLNSTVDTASNNAIIGLIAGNSIAGHPVDFNVTDVQSNLLLMDVIMRKVKGQTKNATNNMRMDEPNDGHAHFLAYNAHIPENVTIPE